MKCTYWNNFCFNPGNLKLEIIENKAKLVNDGFGGLEILIIWGKSLWTLVCPFVIERWPFNSGIPLLALGRAWGCAPCWFLIGDRGYWQGHQPAWGISSQPLLHLDRCVWPGWGLLPPGVCTWGYNFGGGFCGLFFFFLIIWVFSPQRSTLQRKDGIFLKAESLSSSSLLVQHLILFTAHWLLVAQLSLTLCNPMNC